MKQGSKIKSDVHVSCNSHKCTVCKKKLHTEMTKGERMLLAGMFVFYVVIGSALMWHGNRVDSTPSCYVKYTLAQSASSSEYMNIDTPCPNE